MVLFLKMNVVNVVVTIQHVLMNVVFQMVATSAPMMLVL